jgi:exodeoxyribonuclease VII small subunit
MAREKKEKGAEPEADAVRYGAAVAEIEQILSSIDRDEIDIDELSQKVERAVELLKVCRARLKATELRVTQVLQEVAAEKEEEDDEDEADASEAEEAGTGNDPDETSSDSDDESRPNESKPSKSSRRGRAKPDEDLPF